MFEKPLKIDLNSTKQDFQNLNNVEVKCLKNYWIGVR